MKLPAGLAALGRGAFRKAGLRAVDLSHTRVRSIAPLTFHDCGCLGSCVLPAGQREALALLAYA